MPINHLYKNSHSSIIQNNQVKPVAQCSTVVSSQELSLCFQVLLLQFLSSSSRVLFIQIHVLLWLPKASLEGEGFELLICPGRTGLSNQKSQIFRKKQLVRANSTVCLGWIVHVNGNNLLSKTNSAKTVFLLNYPN